MRILGALCLALLLLAGPVAAQPYTTFGTAVNVQSATAISAANASVTLTVPGVTGLYHYFTALMISATCTADVLGSSTIDLTSTNFNSFDMTKGNKCTAGLDTNYWFPLTWPARSASSGTNTTFTCPALGAATFCRITVFYFLGP